MIWLAESTVALSLVGLAGAAWLCVVAVTVTPEETEAPPALMAQTRKLYCVSCVRPVTLWLVPLFAWNERDDGEAECQRDA